MLHIKRIKPLFDSIITTGEKFGEDLKDGSFIIANKGDLKLWQKVVAIGPAVRDVEVGDMVMIDASHFAVNKYDKNSIQNDLGNNATISYHFNWVTMDDENGEPKDFLLISSRDVQYVFEGEERKETIIKPAKQRILVN